MSDSYEIKGVKITPQGGGYYELTHPSLPEPIRERGKEAADARAEKVAKELSPDDGSMTPQGALDANAGASAGTGAGPSDDDKDAQIASLKAALENANSRADELEKAAKPIVQTVTTTQPPVDDSARVPTGIPRKFDPDSDDANAKLFKKLGVDTTKIVLEENSDIPPTGLFVGHNGRSYVIVPGEEVTVPNFILKVLDNAVMSAPVVDSKSQKVLGYRNRSKYPYRRV